MPKWIEQVLIAGAIALFLAITVGIILRALFEIVIIFELAEGDLTWGDIFTLMSLIAAGIIAATGWFLARQNRRKKAERIAQAEFAIFYYKYFPAFQEAGVLLERIFRDSDGVIPNLKEQDAELPGAVLFKHFQRLGTHMVSSSYTFPDVSEAYGQLSNVYPHDEEWGSLMSRAIISMEEIRIQLMQSKGVLAAGRVNQFKGNPEGILQGYYAVLSYLAALLRDFEKIRRIAPGIAFTGPVQAGVMNELRESFRVKFPTSFMGEKSGTNSDAFLEFATKARTKFYDRAQYFQKQQTKN